MGTVFVVLGAGLILVSALGLWLSRDPEDMYDEWLDWGVPLVLPIVGVGLALAAVGLIAF